MKFALALVCLTLAVCAQAAPQAGPPPVPEENLSPQCRSPKCPAKGNVNLPFPLDCLQYIKCIDGVGKVTPCPGDLRYNEAAGKCTGRATANCVNCWQKAPATY